MTAVITGDDGDSGPNLYELIVRVVPEFQHAAAWMDEDYKEDLPWGVVAAFYNFAVDVWRQGRVEVLSRIFEVVETVCAGENTTFENAMCLDFVHVIPGTETMRDFLPLLGPSARECYEGKVRGLRDAGIDITADNK